MPSDDGVVPFAHGSSAPERVDPVEGFPFLIPTENVGGLPVDVDDGDFAGIGVAAYWVCRVFHSYFSPVLTRMSSMNLPF